MQRILPFSQEHRIFKEAFSKFLDKEVVPYYPQWEKEQVVPHQVYEKLGRHGFLCPWADEEYGGTNADFLYSVIMLESIFEVGVQGFFLYLNNDVVGPYLQSFANREQKQRWLPGCTRGDYLLAVAMTEPGAGSDLQAMRTRAVKEGDSYVLNGSKTFISNGTSADLYIVAAKTDPQAEPAYKSMSLFIVEKGTPGFQQGKALEKIGLHAQDTAEIFFDNCRIPADNLLGEEGMGFIYLMQKLQQERLICAMGGVALAERCIKLTTDYVKERRLFGKPLSKFQNTRFELAQMAAEAEIGRYFVDRLIMEHMNGSDVVKEVSMAKYWCCEMSKRVADRCLQLFGGYGYCTEYPIAKLFVDARVFTIFAGTSEVMLEIIGTRLGV